MAAPWDDEPESPAEVEAIQEAYQDVQRGAIVDDGEINSLGEGLKLTSQAA